MTIAEIIDDLSVDLNDAEAGHEFERWTRDQLRSYITEIFIVIAREFRDEFIKQTVVHIEPGEDWQSTCACTDILRVIGESDSCGNIIRRLSRKRDIEANYWDGTLLHCSVSAKNYQIQDYEISKTDPSKFRVIPPVPYGQTKYVVVECYSTPDVRSYDADVPDEFVAMVKQWALYRALIIDAENNPAIAQIAQTHLQTHNALMQTALNQRIRYKAFADEREDNPVRAVQNTPAK